VGRHVRDALGVAAGAALKKTVWITLIGLLASGAIGATSPVQFLVAQRQSCKAASTCQEAVEMWCGGYRDADRDRDGIPCENVCRSKSQVDKIKEDIGC
jgi:hypothetical protein